MLVSELFRKYMFDVSTTSPFRISTIKHHTNDIRRVDHFIQLLPNPSTLTGFDYLALLLFFMFNDNFLFFLLILLLLLLHSTNKVRNGIALQSGSFSLQNSIPLSLVFLNTTFIQGTPIDFSIF